MADVQNPIELIEEEITRDPTNKNWIRIIIIPFIICGLVATLVSANIEYKFFNGVFLNFEYASFFIVLAFEGSKIGAIILYDYAGSLLNNTLKSITWLLRGCLILFSVICSFSEISRYMDSPNFDKNFSEAKESIFKEFTIIMNDESSILEAKIVEAKKDMTDERKIVVRGDWRGTVYEEKKQLHIIAQNNKENRLKQLRTERDSLIKVKEIELRDNPKSANQTLVGVFTTFQNIGMNVDFKPFYSLFVLLIALLTTLSLELIIWTVFGFIGVLYEGVFMAKIEGYQSMTKEIEKTKWQQMKENFKNVNIIEEMKRAVKLNKSKAKSFVDSIENDEQ